jgi:predicted porin
MKHSHVCQSYCVSIAIAALFAVGGRAQAQTGTQITDRVYPAIVPSGPAVGDAPDNPLAALSRFAQQRNLAQLVGDDSSTGPSSLLSAVGTPLEGDPLISPPQSQVPAMSGSNAPFTHALGTEAKPVASSNALTFHGLTFYGLFDVGATHETHGATYDSNSPQIGVEDLISKNGNHALTHFSEDGLGQQYLGLKGREHLFDGVSLIFKLEPGVEPLDMKFTNSIQSLVNNNGVALANQSTNFDTNRSGRIDHGDAWWGFSAEGEQKSASLVYGRVTSLMAENTTKYDFEPGSYAFSLVAYITQVDGGGDSEDFRLDSALKFSGQLGRNRISVLDQIAGHNPVFQPDGVYGSNRQISLGRDFRRLSMDVTYARVHDGIASASLSATQMLTLPTNSLAGTISDNTAYAVMGKYSLDHAGRVKLYGAYDHMLYANPVHPLTAGITTIGGYELSVLTQTAYTTHKMVNAFWGGVRYDLTRKINLSGGYYTMRQNSYSGNGCSDTSAPQCSGNIQVVSQVIAYTLSKYWDVYGGNEWSHVMNGYASGYMYTTNENVTIGGRFHF